MVSRYSFDRIHYPRHDAGVFLYAFDLIEFDGDDARWLIKLRPPTEMAYSFFAGA
jgi:hypothetical protein